ncbi:unnamed protein product [Adineta ricciae]|uniref:Uncharacterized protein n=1 Tax=Adineta ricciae TaxID=249248 RepID=A0A815QN39_ADIRI|nr:unnamed protein product [Adineta ricciae]CAF1465719.1 unnamed protein product [Adineta ricciae]
MTSSIDQADTLELSSTISMITPAEIRANLAQIRYQRCVLIKHDMFPRLRDVQLLIQHNLMDKLIKVLDGNDQDKVWEIPEDVESRLCFLEKVDNDLDSEDDDDDEEEEQDNNNSNMSTTNAQPNNASKTNDVSTQTDPLH